MLHNIYKGWRFIATALAFFLFGVGGFFLSFILFPLLACRKGSQQTKERRVQKIIQKSFKLFILFMKYAGVLDYKFTGLEKLHKDKNCLILANHPSLIDYVLIASERPQCDCIVKAEIWNNPFIKRVVKAAGYISNKDPEDLISRCAQRFNEGNVLLLFPEGTRSTPGKPSKLQRGAAQIAVRTQRDIRIIHISVTPHVLTKEHRWYHVSDSRPFFHIEVKGKIEKNSFIQSNTTDTILSRRLNERLQSALFPEDENPPQPPLNKEEHLEKFRK